MPDTKSDEADCARLNNLLTIHLFSYVDKPNTDAVRKQIFASIIDAYREYLTPQPVQDTQGET